MSRRSTDIIFLIGAGCSVEAGIPASSSMINEIEALLQENRDWREFGGLYNHVKSAIHYAAGLRGSFGDKVSFNIETLVNTLYELERNEEHPLYPFIAAWNSRFVGLAGADFRHVREFRSRILRELKKWMCPEDTSKSEYYNGFRTVQSELNYPLHVFSLNYDLCMERIDSDDFRIETGFETYGPNSFWDWERFELGEGAPAPEMFLYKLHGSINWKRDEGKNLFAVEQIESVDAERMEVIFGRDFKLDAADPYLFYAYQFRRYALMAKMVVVIGYGCEDEHINKMLSQAVKEPGRKILAVILDDNKKDEYRQALASCLEVEEGRVDAMSGGAKAFLSNPDLGGDLINAIPRPAGSPF